MKLCDTCGFYVGPEDIKCRQCSKPIPGRQVFEEIKYTPHKKTEIPQTKTFDKITYFKPKSKLYNFTRKVVILLILTGIIIAPQTQSLVKEGIILSDPIISEKNFDLFIENDKGVNFGKPLKRGNDILVKQIKIYQRVRNYFFVDYKQNAKN